ncbi:MAG TPA: outer membrane protein assembly factor BamA, partial [Candidatus Acidoferrales bacterium]|nr:outer membrane protein assembly factor BamA [Candidatus Acidoferrales bacterium]
KQPQWPTKNPTRKPDGSGSGGGAHNLGRESAALTRAASTKIFVRLFRIFAVVCLCIIAWQDPLWAQQGQGPTGPQYVITRIDFIGNHRIQNDTLRARIFSRAGDPYSEEAVRRDFQALWNTQFFEDVRLEVEDSPDRPDGKIVVFYLKERPIIRRIEYKGNKSISESDILDAFKDKKVGLSVEGQFDPTKIKHAEVVIKELLAEHGRQFATVKPTYERIAATNAVKLVFNIDEGPKVKVGQIKFSGNKVFSDAKLLRAMRHDRPYAIPLYITNIAVLNKTYDRQKLDEDLEIGIKGLYRDHGYFKVSVGDPILNTVDEDRPGVKGPWPMLGSKHGKRVDITIPIEEGEQYRMGSLKFRSSDPEVGLVFKSELLNRVFPIKEGEIFSADKVRKALDNYKKLYGEYGYIDFVADPLTELDDKKKVVNLTMELDQQKQFFVRRIEFSGNTTTRDKVIRREILLDEGQVYNNRLWELSILRLNQLGYFDVIKPENAELKRNVKAGTVDIKLKVHEKGKQSISFSGGVSGIAGTFVSASYQTNNFLGLGETLTLSAQLGSFQKGYTFGFTEPFLFDRPITSGFTIFASKISFNQEKQFGALLGENVALNPALQQNYDTNTKGFTVFVSEPLRRFSFARVGLTYGFSTTDITTFSQSAQLLFDSIQFTSLAGPSALNGIHSSKITPTISYSTVNNPQNPTHGKSFYYGLSFEGGPIGGNVNTFSNTFSTTYFHAVNKHRNVIGVKYQTALITGYGGKDIPPFNRFYLGGEQDVRGFNFYTISPFVAIPFATSTSVIYFDPRRLGPTGAPTQQALTVPLLEFIPTRPGGDYQNVLNLEYRIPIAGPVTLVMFNDLGVNGILRKSQLALDPGAVALFQQQYPNPDFPNVHVTSNLPIISGTNFHPRTSAGLELQVILPIVNAPFRIYYAYNYFRLTGTITAPPGAFSLSDAVKNTLPPGVLQTQIAPELEQVLGLQVQRIPAGLVEPKQTFRFTVGKTF